MKIINYLFIFNSNKWLNHIILEEVVEEVITEEIEVAMVEEGMEAIMAEEAEDMGGAQRFAFISNKSIARKEIIVICLMDSRIKKKVLQQITLLSHIMQTQSTRNQLSSVSHANGEQDVKHRIVHLFILIQIKVH